MKPEVMLRVQKGAYSGDPDDPTSSPSPNLQEEATWGSYPWSFTLGPSVPATRTLHPSDIAGPQGSCFCQTGFLAAVTSRPALGLTVRLTKGANPGFQAHSVSQSTRQSYLGNSPETRLGFTPEQNLPDAEGENTAVTYNKFHRR